VCVCVCVLVVGGTHSEARMHVRESMHVKRAKERELECMYVRICI